MIWGFWNSLYWLKRVTVLRAKNLRSKLKTLDMNYFWIPDALETCHSKTSSKHTSLKSSYHGTHFEINTIAYFFSTANCQQNCLCCIKYWKFLERSMMVRITLYLGGMKNFRGTKKETSSTCAYSPCWYVSLHMSTI